MLRILCKLFQNCLNRSLLLKILGRYLQEENERLTREQEILRSTVAEMEGRIEAQGEILVTRDESVKKLLEMLECRGTCVLF